MAIVPLNTIKSWFRTRLRPTQAQFWDTWDSFWHKSDSIPMSSIEGLENAFNNLDFPTVDATGFRQKEEKNEIGINADFERTVTEKSTSSYRFVNGFTEIHGIELNMAFNYLGREYTFFNAQTTDITLKHGVNSGGSIPSAFDFPEGKDIILKPGEMVKVKFVKTDGNRLELVSKNFSDLVPQVYDGASPTTVLVGGLSFNSDISGKTFSEIIQSIVAPYVAPLFSSFSITGQAQIVEVGTTLSGTKTFTWGITQNSGVIPTVDIYDNTLSATLLAGTLNDSAQAIAITSKLLGADGNTQSWKAIGNNTAIGHIGTINSTNFVVTAQYYRFWKTGVTGTSPVNSSDVRTGTIANFSNSLSLVIPVGNKFVFFAYPKFRADGVTEKGNIVNGSIKYAEGFNSEVGDTFVKTEVQVADANGVLTWYKVYTLILGSAYAGVATYNVIIPT